MGLSPHTSLTGSQGMCYVAQRSIYMRFLKLFLGKDHSQSPGVQAEMCVVGAVTAVIIHLRTDVPKLVPGIT